MTIRLAAVVLACLPATAAAQTEGLFKEYTALAVPRADLPVGAEWIPGVGPNGLGNSENLTVASGMAATSINATVRRKIAFGLGTLLGLDANSVSEKTVKLEGIEILRVRDIGQLPLAAGQQVLFEGIKAKRISITVDKAKGAQLKAALQRKDIPVTADVDIGNNRQITLDGSNLFLAYQVIGFSTPKTRTAAKSHDGTELTLNNTYRFRFCQCLADGGVEIYMTNLMAPTSAGGFTTKKWEMPGTAAWGEYALPPHRRGNEVTAATATVRYFNDRVYLNDTTSSGKPQFLSFFPKERNRIELRTATFKIVPIRNPSATY